MQRSSGFRIGLLVALDLGSQDQVWRSRHRYGTCSEPFCECIGGVCFASASDGLPSRGSEATTPKGLDFQASWSVLCGFWLRISASWNLASSWNQKITGCHSLCESRQWLALLLTAYSFFQAPSKQPNIARAMYRTDGRREIRIRRPELLGCLWVGIQTPSCESTESRESEVGERIRCLAEKLEA